MHGVDLAWSERGRAPSGTPTLVLCHGYTGSSHDFALQVDALAADRRVLTLDHRGHGHSTKTGHARRLHHRAALGRPGRLLEAEGEGPVDLLGHSMGGRVVMGAGAGPARPRALADPDGHQRLVLPAAGRGDPRRWSSGFIEAFDPAEGMPTTLSMGGPEDDAHRGGHAGAVAPGEGRHLRRHGSLRRQGTGRRADGRRGR